MAKKGEGGAGAVHRRIGSFIPTLSVVFLMSSARPMRISR